MSRKALSIFVDVDIQAVTCPGVWLCPNGRVRLVLTMLGQEVHTRRLPPVFPLLIHEHFDFYKVFPSAGCLSELQSLLGIHDVEAALLQEVEGETPVQLARFSCSVLHLLFPSPCSKGLLAGVDVDLLMEASGDFPGILAPKIELSTRTTVEEITDNYASPENYSEAYVINPKTLVSRTRCNGNVSEGGEPHVREYKGGSPKKQRVRRASFIEDNRQKTSVNRRATSVPRRTCQKSPGGDGEFCLSTDSVDPCNTACPCRSMIAAHVDSHCSLCNRYKAVFRDSVEPINGTETNIKSRRCRCPDRQNCAFVRCRRSPRLLKADGHSRKDHHCKYYPAAAAHSCELRAEKTSSLGRVTCTVGTSTCPCPCSQSAPKLQRDGLFPNERAKSWTEFSKISEEVSDEQSTDTPGVAPGQEDRRISFYSNLERYYRKLYMRARERASRMNSP